MLLAFILAVVQGVTEFLPVSSSMHLNFVSSLINHNISHQELSAFCIFLNIGTLLALVAHYKAEVFSIIKGCFDFILLKNTNDRSLFINIAVANIPTVIVFGYVEICCGGQNFSASTMAAALFFFSFVLFFCDIRGPVHRDTAPTMREWIIAGLAQLFSIVPGVSRLGSNLCAFRLLGFSRCDSFKYSMLLSIPPVLGACTLKIVKIVLSKHENIFFFNDLLNIPCIVFGIVVAYICGRFTLNYITSFLERFSISLFCVYRIAFAIVFWRLVV